MGRLGDQMERKTATLVILGVFLAACASQPGAETVDDRARDLEPELPSADAASGVDEVLALVERGAETWEESCERANAEGLCLEFVLVKEDATRCGEPVLGDVVVHARDVDAAKAAQADFAEALELALDLEAPGDDTLRMRYKSALATARLAQVDAKLEAYFGIDAPSDVDFTVEEWKRDSGVPKWEAEYTEQVAKKEASMQRFKDYFEAKTRAGQDVMKDFASVKQFGDVEVVLRAALRTSWTSVHFHDQMTSFEIPVSMRDKEDFRTAYCGALAGQAERPREQGVDAAIYCREKANEAGFEGSVVQTCSDLLAKLQPAAKTTSQ